MFRVESGEDILIELHDVKKVYQTDAGPVEALSSVSLKVRRGEIFGVIGYSGAGKSTLIRLINLLEKPTSGQVEVDGKILSDLSGKQLRKERQRIGMIFQHFNLLWSRTAAENVAFPLELTHVPRKRRQERVAELINLVGLSGRETSYPAQLSGGQKQRVGIARALASNPDVLLCDEATSALDPKTTDSILHLLRQINQKLGITIVIITHEMHVIHRICDRVAVLDRGRIVEEGPVADIFLHPRRTITREFVGQLDDRRESAERIRTFHEAHPEAVIVRISFSGTIGQQPVVDILFRNRALDVRMIEGALSSVHDGPEGALVLQLTGDEDDIRDAIATLRKKRLDVEVVTP